jgi:hypothetical protein
MNDDYYNNLILMKLKKDVITGIKEILDNHSYNIIQEEVENYFNSNEIVFLEPVKKYGIKECKTHIYRDRKNYKEDENRCIARVWNEGMGGQCACKSKYDKFCKRHKDKGGYDWCFGTIDRPRPENPRNHKGKIHRWLN